MWRISAFRSERCVCGYGFQLIEELVRGTIRSSHREKGKSDDAMC